MENQTPLNLEPEIKVNGETKRKRKLLNDPNSLWAKCRECKEPGNLENMFYLKVPFADSQGKVVFGCYEGVYFCGEICQEKFKLAKLF